jgi:cytochrome P450 family 4
MGCEITNEDYTYLNAVKDLTYHVATSFLSPLHRIKFFYDLTPTKRKQVKCAKILHDFTLKVIEKRRELLANSEKQSLENLDDDIGLKKKMCLLDVLLQSTIDNKPLSNQDIQEEVDTFTFAGHDTTSTAIAFTLYLISIHPECQQKLLKEIDDVIGDGEVTFKSLNEFRYLDLVIKESLRLYPPVPIISRRLNEDFDFGDFVGPANANYNLSLFLMFRDPSIFENPDEFIPERFLKNLPPFAFIPFSAVSMKL